MKNNWRRYQKNKHIKRKQWIIKNVYRDKLEYWDKGQRNRLDSIKIHCSCPICSAKTARDGYTISDQRKIDKLEYCE